MRKNVRQRIGDVMGDDWHEYFEDFPEENEANYVNGRFDPEGARLDRERREKLATDQSELDSSIAQMITAGQERAQARRDAHRALQEGRILTAEFVDAVWARIDGCAGEAFETITAKPFTYTVNGHVLTTNRTSFGLSKSDFITALRVVPVDGPGVIVNEVRGSAYIWAILHDYRIRLDEW